MNSLRFRSCLAAAAVSSLSLTLVGRAHAATTKVACLGEQTTKSNEAPGPMWPTLLQTALGANYDVVNDAGDTSGSILTGYDTTGVGADPVMSASNTAYQDSLTANVVVIGPFGEHDQRVVSKFPAMGTEMIFEQDYDALVMSYLNLASNPTVYVTTPIQVPTFDAATQALVSNVVLPAVKAVALKHSEVKLVDLYTAFLGHEEYFMGMGDGQTNAAGELELEQLVYAAMQTANSAAGGAGGSGGAAGSAGSTAGSSGSGASAGAGGASGGTGGLATSSAGSSNASAGTGTTASAGAAQQPTDESPASSESSCSIASAGANRASRAWLALAGAFSGLALTRARRRQQRRAATR
ncbi:MAG TPA: hypothetical protein VK745_02185 [Polyangiaceae bacterium]|nr:hypothetical protein [Polyangiaceae bacterium]